MPWKFAIASTARGLVFAGFSLLMIATNTMIPRADAASLPKQALRGIDGRRIDLSAPAHGAMAIVFYSTECPISNSYSPTLATLADAFHDKPVKWLGVCVDPDLSDSEVAGHARDFGLKFPVVHDRYGSLGRKLGAKVTPESFVIDDTGKIRYHGRIDDQFAARRQRNANFSATELKDAIVAVLTGKAVTTEHVEAVGCPLPEIPKSAARPTYAKDVAPILQKNCQECHRPGQVGPFSLETFDQARKRASDIVAVVENRSMPPWKAAPHFGVKFKDARSLSEDEIATLVAWSEADAPEGNPADLPLTPKFPDDWQLGTPDLVVDIGADFAVPAGGDDIYRCFVVPTHLDKDQYVAAVEYRPGNRSVVHHMLAYVDISGKARERDQAEPGPGYTCFGGPGEPIHGGLGGWAPGNLPSFLPDGIGRSLPKQSDVIVQVHYHPRGKPETDRSKIGLYFSKKPVKQVMHWGFAINPGLELPPGQSNIEVKAAWEVPVDVTAHAVTPHMHLLGRDMLMSVKFPDGHVQDLIKIPDWDFNWQYTYHFEQPLDIPKGSVVYLVAHYDNSDSNPRNPHKPPVLVKWGEATTDEMCIGFIGLTKKGQDLTKPGEKDDFIDILRQQEHELREKYEKKLRDHPKPDKPRAGADGGK
ncbi:MAG TPA: redoxin family protein [Isosphaeraceae bacterium]|nr:redoxin family protein [Isosphaeraceae bacterium]